MLHFGQLRKLRQIAAVRDNFGDRAERQTASRAELTLVIYLMLSATRAMHGRFLNEFLHEKVRCAIKAERVRCRHVTKGYRKICAGGSRYLHAG